MSTQIQQAPAVATHPTDTTEVSQVIVYGHSWILYWWPLWVTGYVIAFLTWMNPERVVLNGREELFYPSREAGVVFSLIFLLMIVLTSSQVRGVFSAVVVISLAFLALLFAYLNWWGVILNWLGSYSIYMNLGFYLFFSSALFVIWFVTVVIVDHMSYWRFRPGMVTHEFVLGAVDQSYDTGTMVLSKRQDDLFRHWILGLGSGDLRMKTMGGQGLEAKVSNVLFLAGKMTAIQRLIATKPDVTQQA